MRTIVYRETTNTIYFMLFLLTSWITCFLTLKPTLLNEKHGMLWLWLSKGRAGDESQGPGRNKNKSPDHHPGRRSRRQGRKDSAWYPAWCTAWLSAASQSIASSPLQTPHSPPQCATTELNEDCAPTGDPNRLVPVEATVSNLDRFSPGPDDTKP